MTPERYTSPNEGCERDRTRTGMYEQEQIARLHAQGYCTGYISIRLNVSSAYVRQVLAKHSAHRAIEAVPPKPKRTRAEITRDAALRRLAEAQAVLDALA